MRGIERWSRAVESATATDAGPARFFVHGGNYGDVGKNLVRLVRHRCYGGGVLAVVRTPDGRQPRAHGDAFGVRPVLFRATSGKRTGTRVTGEMWAQPAVAPGRASHPRLQVTDQSRGNVRLVIRAASYRLDVSLLRRPVCRGPVFGDAASAG